MAAILAFTGKPNQRQRFDELVVAAMAAVLRRRLAADPHVDPGLALVNAGFSAGEVEKYLVAVTCKLGTPGDAA